MFAPEPFIEKKITFSTALLLEFCQTIGSCIGEGQFGELFIIFVSSICLCRDHAYLLKFDTFQMLL